MRWRQSQGIFAILFVPLKFLEHLQPLISISVVFFILLLTLRLASESLYKSPITVPISSLFPFRIAVGFGIHAHNFVVMRSNKVTITAITLP